MMKEVSDVKETAEEINGLKNKVSEVRSINYFIINCISSPTSLSCTLCIMKLKVFSLLFSFVYVVGKTNFKPQ